MEKQTITAAPISTKRLIWGGGILVIGFLSPLAVPLVTVSGLSKSWKAVLSGLLMVGIPEIFMLVAVGIMGKQGYEFLKEKFLAFFRRQVVTQEVSRNRYRIGLVLFAIPILYGWGTPYLTRLFPVLSDFHLTLGIAGDLVLLVSLVILGGDFWEKLQALFVYEARVRRVEIESEDEVLGEDGSPPARG